MNSSSSLNDTAVRNKHDVGGILCAALFILLGGVCLYETTRMTDPDSYMFPRMVITCLMGLSFVLIVSALLKPVAGVSAESDKETAPSSIRRVLLVGTMIGGTLLMPLIGFVLSGLIIFVVLMALAQYDPWTRSKAFLYSLVGVAIVVGFYGVFTYLLQVSLPEGSWLQLS